MDMLLSVFNSWGTVTFANAQDCSRAEASGNGKSIGGRNIRVEISNGDDYNRRDDRGGRGSRSYDDGPRGGGGCE